MANNVLITPFAFQQAGFDLLRTEGLEVRYYPGKPRVEEEALLELIRDADAFIAGSEAVNKRVLDHAPRLKVIARFGVGYDRIDWKYALDKGIPTTVAIGTNEQSVAELVFAHMLALARNIPFFDRTMRSGIWSTYTLGHEMWRKTIGVIGTGRVGKAVAVRAKGFEMNVLACDPCPDPEWAARQQVRYAALEEVLAVSDVVTLHVPCNEQTEGMVSASFLTKMKPTAYLINTARGGLVDEAALYRALRDGRIAGAALDVFAAEPPPADHPWLSLDNVVLTSHVGSHTFEAMVRMSVCCAEEVVRVMNGRPPLHPVAPSMQAGPGSGP